MIFDLGVTTFDEFTDYVEEFIHKPCPEAIACLRGHDWTSMGEAPFEYAYQLLLEFGNVQGPAFRGGTIVRLGEDPFWAAMAWMNIAGLTDEEYRYLFGRWFWRYRERYGRMVEEGSLLPGSRAIVRYW